MYRTYTIRYLKGVTVIRQLTTLCIIVLAVVVAGCGNTTTTTTTAVPATTITLAVATTTTESVNITTVVPTTSTTLVSPTTTLKQATTKTTKKVTTTTVAVGLDKLVQPGEWSYDGQYAHITAHYKVKLVELIDNSPEHLQIYLEIGGYLWMLEVGSQVDAQVSTIEPLGDDTNEYLSKYSNEEVGELYDRLNDQNNLVVEVK